MSEVISPLRRRMIEDMTIRNLSPATERSYLHAVAKFSRYFGRSPDHLGLEDARALQVHLVATGISWPSLNQTVRALRFFYGVTLGQNEIPKRIAYPQQPCKLPVVLSPGAVVRFEQRQWRPCGLAPGCAGDHRQTILDRYPIDEAGKIIQRRAAAATVTLKPESFLANLPPRHRLTPNPLFGSLRESEIPRTV